jgi:hypothetical protein
MRTTALSLICGLGLLAAACAAPHKHQSLATQAPETGGEQLVCRAPVHEGQLLPGAKQCYTKAEWEARQKRMQNSIRDLQMRSLTLRPE